MHLKVSSGIIKTKKNKPFFKSARSYISKFRKQQGTRPAAPVLGSETVSVSLRPDCSTYQAPSQPRLHDKTVPQQKKRKKKDISLKQDV